MWFLDYVSHIWGVPTMEITDLSILRKWENLKNRQCIKYLFAPLCLQCPREMFIVSQSVLYAVFFF